MPLQSSGAISLLDIQNEFGGTNPIDITEYYRGGGLVPNTTTNVNIPTSGTISLSNFYGASNLTFWGAVLTLSGSTSLSMNGIAVNSTSEIFVAGHTVGNLVAYIGKYNSNGVVQWQRRLSSGSVTNTFNDVAIDSSSNAYAVGITNAQGSGASDSLLAKYNSSGTIQWQRILGSSTNDTARTVAVTSGGDVYFSADTNGGNIFVKYDTNGTIQWQRRLGTYNTIYHAVGTDSSSNLYVAFGTATNSNRFIIAKYNSAGTLQWQRYLTAGTLDNFYPADIIVTSAGVIYITANIVNTSPSTVNFVFVAKFDTNGNLLWQRTAASGTTNFFPSTIRLDSSENVHVSYYQQTSNQLSVLKFNSSGTIQWQLRISYTGGNFPRSIALDPSGNLHFSGSISGAGGSIGKVRSDGTPNTGFYGSWSFSVPTLTIATPSYTSSVSSETGTTPTLTAATSTLNDAAESVTSVLTTW